jgi:hypothetical protein
MKRIVLALCATGLVMTAAAQSDSTKTQQADTIKVGGMIIIKRGDRSDTARDNSDEIVISNTKKKPSNISTNWWIVDLGFSNFNDKTQYSAAATQAFAPGSSSDRFDLRTGKSVNVNIWLFMQRVNLISHVVNLKYGLGLELNNYRFEDETIEFQENPTLITFNPAKDVKKNKLAVDYITAPLMLNFNFNPRKEGFGFSAGVSAGYLYAARQKTKQNDDKEKIKDDFDLRKWKLAYVGELSLGPVKLYGSYAFQSMWEKGLDQTPYNFGIRFSNW